MDAMAQPTSHDPEPGVGVETQFAPVGPGKFVLLSLATFGLYELVWQFRNWRYVRRAEASRIWPGARAIFAPLWYYSLLRRLEVRGRVGLTAAYWIIVSAWRLPDPYWLVSYLSFLPLLPALNAVNRLNQSPAAQPPSYRWRTRDWPVAALGGALVLLGGLGAFGPSTAVVAGADLRAAEEEFLRDAGLLNEAEEVLYFYSPGFLSIRGEGVLATDGGVRSYWIDPVTEELTAAYLPYGQILEVEANFSSTVLGETMVRVRGVDGSWFVFSLSAEGGGDRTFLAEVDRRRGALASSPRVTA